LQVSFGGARETQLNGIRTNKMKTPTTGQKMRTMLPVMLTGFLLLTVAGCSSRKGGIEIEIACNQWDYIYASRYDTLETTDQILEYNLRREAFCKGY